MAGVSPFGAGFVSGNYSATQDLKTRQDAAAFQAQQIQDMQQQRQMRDYAMQQALQKQRQEEQAAQLGIDALRGPIPPAPGQASQPGPQGQPPQGGPPAPPEMGGGMAPMPSPQMPQGPGAAPMPQPQMGQQGPMAPMPQPQIPPYQRMPDSGAPGPAGGAGEPIQPKPSSVIDQISDAAAKRGITDPVVIMQATQNRLTYEQAQQAAVMAAWKMKHEMNRDDQAQRTAEATRQLNEDRSNLVREQLKRLQAGQSMTGRTTGAPGAAGVGGPAAAPPQTDADFEKKAKALGWRPEAIDRMAESYRLTGKMPTQIGRTKADAPLRQLVMNRAAAMGGSAADSQVNAADHKALSTTLTALEKWHGMVGSYEETAVKSANLVAKLADKGASPTTFNKINQWINSGRVQTNDKDVINFNNAMNTFVHEYAKIMSGGTGAAATTEGAAHRAQELLNQGMSSGAVKSVIDQLKQEMKFRIDSNQEQIDKTRERLRNIGKTPAAPTGGAAPAGGGWSATVVKPGA